MYVIVFVCVFVFLDLNCMVLLLGLDLYNFVCDVEKCTVERFGYVEDDDDEDDDEDVVFVNEGEV